MMTTIVETVQSPAGAARRLRAALLGTCCALAAAGGVAAEPKAEPTAAPFEAAAGAIVQNPAAATEAQLLDMLRLAREAGRPYAGNLAIKAWLAKQQNPPAPVILAAADIAALAGDLRSAAARYKAFLAAAPAGEERSLAAARLYEILVDDLSSADDAYAFMVRQGAGLRQSREARWFDLWFIDQAQARGDLASAATRLVDIMTERMPLELERLLIWDRLDALMNALATATPDQFAALLPARKLPGMVRESPARAARHALIVAWLEYRATAAGKDPTALAKSFEPVVAAATAYVEAVPTAATLGDVMNIFGCGNPVAEAWQSQGGPIRAWWTASFAKLPDTEKPAAINWNNRWQLQASGEQWVQLGTRFPEVFKKAPGTASLPLLAGGPDPAVYKAQSQFLAGVPSDAARVVNALAASGGTNLVAGLAHLWRSESWYGSPEAITKGITDLWPTFKSFPRQPATTDADLFAAAIQWGPEAIAKSPLALLHPPAAAVYLQWAWAGSNPKDMASFVPHLRGLDWAPWDDKTRQAVIGPAHTAFKAWADTVRKGLAGPQKADWEKAAAQIAQIEEEFKKALDPSVSATADVAASADPLAGHMVRCVRALQKKDLAGYVAAARPAYALVRDYCEKKTPLGQAVLTWLVTNRLDAFDTIDFQREVIADQMAIWKPGVPAAALLAIDTAVFAGRPGWSFPGGVQQQDRERALAFAKTIGDGIVAQLGRGGFSTEFLERFRRTRRGPGWQEQVVGKEVLAALIESKAFLVHQGPSGRGRGASDYASLIRQEFQGLAGQFPAETALDDLFVEESKASGWLDWGFTTYSRDEKRKVANRAAERFATCQSLATGPGNPFGYDALPARLAVGGQQVFGAVVPWTAVDIWNWHSRGLAADPPLAGRMLETATSAWGKTRYDFFAMGMGSLRTDLAVMQKPDTRSEWFRTLAAALERAQSHPVRGILPNLAALEPVQPRSLSDDELASLLSIFAGGQPQTWSSVTGAQALLRAVADGLLAKGRHADLARLSPRLWRIAKDTGRGDLIGLLASVPSAIAKAGSVDLAASFADAGLEMFGTNLPEDVRSRLAAVRAEAMLASGGANPVPRADPRWAVYEAQIAFKSGKRQAAWDRYATSPQIATQIVRELDPEFTIWLIRENSQTGHLDRARDLGQAMLSWSESTPGSLDAEAQAALLVAYADIAMARREYPQARALYERIGAAQEFEGTLGKRDAELRIAEVDRLTRQFGTAKDRLEKLTRRPDRALQAEAYYQLAMLKSDQDEIEEAAGDLEQVFMRVPEHVNGRILEGVLNLKRKKYDVASKVRLGAAGDKKTLIPGKPLEVELEDKNLAIVGKATQIQIRVWTDGGDEERFNLFPFGDSKTRFSGQLPTALGAARKGDRVLQVVGDDTVHYGFADSVAAAGGKADEAVALSVVTDADLFASSGRILSKEEQQNRELERQIRQKLQLDAGADRQAALAESRSDDQVKPGNPINVRVADPDRSRTGEKDTVRVTASTASGDGLVVELAETGPYTGVFEGSVPTGGSQPTAYATDSGDGSDPNSTIDPRGGGPWIALADGVRPKLLSVDLNDNVPLGTMTVTANVPGRKLKDVTVQTSLNGRDFRSVAQWRADGKETLVPWDGSPMMELVRFPVGAKPPQSLPQFVEFIGRDRFAKQLPHVMAQLPSMAFQLDGNFNGLAPALFSGPGSDWYVGHWWAGFAVPKSQSRTLTLQPKGNNVRFLIAVDGVVSDKPDAPLSITRMLDKGAHRVDVYAHAQRGSQAGFEILLDSPDPPFAAPAPAEFFAPAKHPEIAEAFAVQPATVKAEGDGSTLEVAFGKKSRARVVRLLIGDYETDAPAVNTITLVDRAGKKILPTAKSFTELAKNDILEIIPGDRITVSYEDPAVITKALEKQDRFLTATFTNAQISAAFVEFRNVGQGDRRADYYPMRRFKPGDPVKVIIDDPDMDVSDAQDTVEFTARDAGGEPITLEALETESHSGTFLGTVFPVAGKPERPSELTIGAGADLRLAYLDRENTDPGIAWERASVVEQIGSDDPHLRVYDVASRPLDAQEIAAVESKAQVGRRLEEVVPVTRDIIAVRPEKPSRPDRPAKVLVDGPLLVEVLAPRIAQSPRSTAEIFVQTESGREKLGRPVAEGEFPLDVPGTIRLARQPGSDGAGKPPAGVRNVVVGAASGASDPLTDGRFGFLVDKALGPVPDTSLVDQQPAAALGGNQPQLQIRGNDVVYVGFRYADAAGQERWLVQPVALASDALFDVMDQRYQKSVSGIHVGETLHLRAIHPSLDTTDEKDSVTVKLAASGGGVLDLVLTETFGHSGIFKGAAKLAYRETDRAGQAQAGDDGRTLPVTYGETVKVTYPLPEGKAIEKAVSVFKGDDAEVVPFTKQFKDPEIAVQTQFTVAEAWFELAKRHRELGDEGLARREIAQGKKLLEEAINDYPDTQARAQADYLLANLAFEFSRDSSNEDLARQFATEAVARFSEIVANHPDSEYAPRSQFKKALVLEKLGQIDEACAEYVKLSYRYPDNELVAETIARLGQYFLGKGKELDAQTKSLNDPVEREKVSMQGREMFKTAAQVFGRLGERFPQHALAGKTQMLSAQCYLRANDLERAIAGYERVYKDPKADKELAPEAMYWAGDAHMKKEQYANAYRAFKKLTWDYPETKWAKFARGRLTEGPLVQAASKDENNGN